MDFIQQAFTALLFFKTVTVGAKLIECTCRSWTPFSIVKNTLLKRNCQVPERLGMGTSPTHLAQAVVSPVSLQRGLSLAFSRGIAISSKQTLYSYPDPKCLKNRFSINQAKSRTVQRKSSDLSSYLSIFKYIVLSFIQGKCHLFQEKK